MKKYPIKRKHILHNQRKILEKRRKIIEDGSNDDDSEAEYKRFVKFHNDLNRNQTEETKPKVEETEETKQDTKTDQIIQDHHEEDEDEPPPSFFSDSSSDNKDKLPFSNQISNSDSESDDDVQELSPITEIEFEFFRIKLRWEDFKSQMDFQINRSLKKLEQFH